MRNLWLQFKNFFINLWFGIKSLRSFRRLQLPQIIENFSRKEFYFTLATIALIVLSAGFLISRMFVTTGPGPHEGGELTEGLVGQPRFINPVLSLSSNVDTDISRVVYAQLLKFDADQNMTPDLADGLPTVSKDQKTYTLHLKPDLKWQDGKPLNADDVAFTIATIQNADFESPLRPNWARVKVTKVDDLTLTFELREISASFMTNFALGIIPKHIWDGMSGRNFRLSDGNLKPVGSGPYSIQQIRKTSDGTIKSMTLHANNYYYQGTPYIDTLTFNFYSDYDGLLNAYQGKEIQSLGYVPFDKKAFLAESATVSQYRVNLPQYEAVFFNLAKNVVLREKAVRQALWLVTDRNQIVNDVYNGNAAPAYGPILPGSLGYDADIEKSIHYSTDEAGAILDKAAWVVDPSTQMRYKMITTTSGKVKTESRENLEFNLVISGDLVLNVKTAQIIQDQWAKIGAKVDLVVVSPSDLETQYIRPRNFDALLFSENVGADPDPFPFWASSQVHDPGLNFASYTNTQADKLLTDARQTTDAAIRAKDYTTFQEVMNSDLPAIFLARSLYIYNVPKKIQGISLDNIVSPSDRFLDINHWYFSK